MTIRKTASETHSDDADKYALGGIMWNYGFRRGDAPALDALLTMSPGEFVEACATNRIAPSARVGSALAMLVDVNPAGLHSRGKALELDRRRDSYRRARHDWEENGDNGPNAKWRSRTVTRNQRFLIAEVCASAQIEPPELMTRGQAADWLESQGAHPHLRGDDE